MDKKEEIKRIVSVLIGERIQYISRSCELVEIGFGDAMCKKNIRGNDIVVPTYALHVQCPFRVSNSKEVIVGSDDLFVSSLGIENIVDLSVKNVCVFDEIVIKHNNFIKNDIVCDLEINKYGDLILYFSDYTISIFSASSTDMENWRFFKTGPEGIHVIKNGNSFEIIEP